MFRVFLFFNNFVMVVLLVIGAHNVGLGVMPTSHPSQGVLFDAWLGGWFFQFWVGGCLFGSSLVGDKCLGGGLDILILNLISSLLLLI